MLEGAFMWPRRKKCRKGVGGERGWHGNKAKRVLFAAKKSKIRDSKDLRREGVWEGVSTRIRRKGKTPAPMGDG